MIMINHVQLVIVLVYFLIFSSKLLKLGSTEQMELLRAGFTKAEEQLVFIKLTKLPPDQLNVIATAGE